MSESINLAAMLRTGSVADLKDFLPAVVYGSGIEATSLTVKRLEFEKALSIAGESGLIMLKLDNGQEMPVIIKDYQTDAVKHRIIHADFYKVNMNEKVDAEVSLHFIGEAPAVKAFGAIIVEHLDQLHIECLPSDLVQKIDVDISVLANMGDAIYVKDIALPKGVVVTNEPDALVINAVEPKKTVEETPAAPAEGEAAAAPAEGAAPAEEKKEE